MRVKKAVWPIVLLWVCTLAVLPVVGGAQVIKETNDPLDALAVADDRLQVQPAIEPVEDVETSP
jgi:hypothetical protein